jgi:hypothetical protein
MFDGATGGGGLGAAVLGRPGSDGFLLARLLATAVVDLADHPSPASFGLPYPVSAQRVLDLLGARALLHGTRAPASVPDLVHWCREIPLSRWGLDLPAEAVTDADVLVDAVTCAPSQLCYEWAVAAPDAVADLVETDLLPEVIAICRERRLQQSYVAFRRLLVQQPVIGQADWMAVTTNPHLEPLLDLVRDCYQPMPAAYIRGGYIRMCGRCRCPLVPATDGSWACELDRCRWEGLALGEQVSASRDLQVALRPLRVFVTGPGRAETELEQAMTDLGLQVEMWPNVDAYDLRISFPSGKVWAVDVKDRVSPVILGRTATTLRAEPPYTSAFYVAPDYRRAQREDYGRAFRAACQAARDGEFTFEFSTELIRSARKEARRA